MAQLRASQVQMAVGALEPPAGVIPEFESKSYYSTTMVLVLLPVTSAFILVRMYQKTFVLKSREWEDCKYSLWLQACWLSIIALMHFRYQLHRVGKIHVPCSF